MANQPAPREATAATIAKSLVLAILRREYYARFLWRCRHATALSLLGDLSVRSSAKRQSLNFVKHDGNLNRKHSCEFASESQSNIVVTAFDAPILQLTIVLRVVIAKA